MLSAALAIACYISPNPSPFEWMVSGSGAEVRAVERTVLATPGVEVVDRASGAQLDFVRFRAPVAVRYADFMSMVSAAWRPGVLSSPPAPTIPSCGPDGRAADIGASHARPVVLGVFGSADDLSRVRRQNGWAGFSDIVLASGQAGIALQPSSAQASQYEAFVAQARRGELGNLDVVLLVP